MKIMELKNLIKVMNMKEFKEQGQGDESGREEGVEGLWKGKAVTFYLRGRIEEYEENDGKVHGTWYSTKVEDTRSRNIEINSGTGDRISITVASD